jgi:hypothetical protein
MVATPTATCILLLDAGFTDVTGGSDAPPLPQAQSIAAQSVPATENDDQRSAVRERAPTIERNCSKEWNDIGIRSVSNE